MIADKILLLQGDITLQDTDAIVNAANSSLMGGGGVDGAIHRSGGPAILQQCRQIVARQGPCLPGQAVFTTGGLLQARYIIHTVGPIWRGGTHNEPQILRDAYLNCLTLAAGLPDVHTIAFPSISTGAYRFPLAQAAGVALQAVADFLQNPNPFTQIRFVLFTPVILEQYQLTLSQLNNSNL